MTAGLHEPLTTDWMETLSGRKFSPFDEDPDFELRDLVWGVARAQRYAGQFKEEVEHYSVAEHQVLMARWLMARERHTFDLGMAPGEFKEVVRCAATHDLPEGLLLDMVRPIKRHDAFYRQAEARFSGAIARRYGLLHPMHVIVKELDNRILVDERAQAMNPSGNHWGSIDGQEPMGITLQFWSPRRAAKELFDLLDELGVHD
jgi:uncharacterized protein